jgi:hypothetical protein
MSDMTTTVREFQRRFSRMRRVAAAGGEVRIRDQKTGEEFAFKAVKSGTRGFWGLAGHLAGVAKGGPADLATNQRHLEGFGRASADR